MNLYDVFKAWNHTMQLNSQRYTLTILISLEKLFIALICVCVCVCAHVYETLRVCKTVARIKREIFMTQYPLKMCAKFAHSCVDMNISV